MKLILISSALLASAAATPAFAAQMEEVPAVAAAPADDEDKAEDSKLKPSDFDMSKVMAALDKMFPPQPEPAPQRLALARTTAAGVLPNGTYASMFDEFASGMIDHVLSLSEADFDMKDKKGKPASKTTLRQQLATEDPHFEERLRIMRRVIGEELIKISAVMEPKMREGLARSIARRANSTRPATSSAAISTLRTPFSFAVPALPGATMTSATRGDCATFHANACSRPPEPMMRIFMLGERVSK